MFSEFTFLTCARYKNKNNDWRKKSCKYFKKSINFSTSKWNDYNIVIFQSKFSISFTEIWCLDAINFTEFNQLVEDCFIAKYIMYSHELSIFMKKKNSFSFKVCEWVFSLLLIYYHNPNWSMANTLGIQHAAVLGLLLVQWQRKSSSYTQIT